MSKIIFLDAGSFKKPVNVYLITNCVDDAHVCTSNTKLKEITRAYPSYTVYEWPQLRYYESYGGTSIAWQRPCKRTKNGLKFDDTSTPWEMLKLAKSNDQWYTNRRFDSINYAMKVYANRKYYKVCGYDVPIEEETNSKSIWFSGFAGAEITDRTWLAEYKNKLHPNDDWTNVNLETYVKWIRSIDEDERDHVISAAIEAGVVGYLD